MSSSSVLRRHLTPWTDPQSGCGWYVLTTKNVFKYAGEIFGVTFTPENMTTKHKQQLWTFVKSYLEPRGFVEESPHFWIKVEDL